MNLIKSALAVCAVAAASFISTSADACGIKHVLRPPSHRAIMSYRTTAPGRILIYKVSQGDKLKHILQRAGHTVTMTDDKLENGAAQKFDLVLTGVEGLKDTAGMQPGMVVPVLVGGEKSVGTYRFSLNGSQLYSVASMKVIEDAIRARSAVSMAN
jgi:hypothetical protein